MRYFLSLLFTIGFLSVGSSQIFTPVSWETSVEKISDNEFNLVMTAEVDETWHLYSQVIPEGGPIPTTFTFEEADSYQLMGSTSEEEGEIVDDPVFEMKIKYFDGKVAFKQRIKTTQSAPFKIKGSVEYMSCNDTTCTPPTEADLAFNIGVSSNHSSIDQEEATPKDEDAATLTDVIKDIPTKKEEVTTDNTTEEISEKPIDTNRSLLSIFIVAFLGGLLALATPCVFPMIPMTVSYFTKQSKSKSQGVTNASIYGISIILVYVVLGLVITSIFGPDALNALSTSVWFNLLFFVILIIFSVSFLGAFEIALPSSWATRIDNKADKGGVIGIFFMAMALAIVSFSCTGPIVGTLLVDAAVSGNRIAPIVGMFGFSSAIAIPFALFAAFPGWMNSLPKSGGWLNTVKVVLGFIELAFAFKFLSNADLVLELHLFEREVFLAIWIAIFLVLALYLLGKIHLSKDGPTSHISVGRLSLGLFSLAFSLYMLPGLWGAPLNLISALPPPQHYSESPYGVGYSKLGAVTSSKEAFPEGAHLMAPHDILVFNDYDLGLAYAKKVNKPVMIDFTGHSCVNCRKMEQNVWAKEKVLSILKNEVVLISLYVDDKRALNADEIVDSKLRPGKKLKYIGQKWSEFQTLKYGTNAQPYYVLIDHQEENLIKPVAYTPNVDKYYDWLKEGMKEFEKRGSEN